jgi:hypothetical protein
MLSLLNFFQPKPTALERVPSDTVIPLFSRDDTHPNRSIAIEFTMKFDGVLDGEKLSGALWKLIDRPGWRKLGARLRLNVQNRNLTLKVKLNQQTGPRQTRISRSRRIYYRAPPDPVQAYQLRHAYLAAFP